MAAAAGYHWLRQEFPWEDIEIHGKGDFEDRRQSRIARPGRNMTTSWPWPRSTAWK